jgi:alpha-methylacyl-CoA racemase
VTRPLDDLFVLDFSTLLPGPLATLLLAEAGAEVLKIERPGTGEDMRHYAPPWAEVGATFALLNRGKNSLAIDLKADDARDVLLPLVRRADVLVEQFRPGVMARLGLGPEALAEINPRLIYCSVTAYGQTGPKRDKAGHDLNILAESGLLALSADDAERPSMPPSPLADIAAGAYPAFMNILLALRARDRTGRGCHLDIALNDNVFTLAYWALAQGFATGQWPARGDHLVTGGSPRYRLYRTADGGTLAVAALEEKFWARFCEVVGLSPGLRDDGVDPAATTEALVQIIRAESSPVWERRLAGQDCCCSVVVGLERALSDPQTRARAIFDHQIAGENGAAMPALPVPVDPSFRGDPRTLRSAPRLGDRETGARAAPVGETC